MYLKLTIYFFYKGYLILGVKWNVCAKKLLHSQGH